MPYKSVKQERFFEGCKHNPTHMKGSCPDEATLNEFHTAEYGASKRVKAKRALGYK